MRRKLGQHFLVDQQMILRILSTAAITPDDLIIEIGPGKGSLTRPLADQATRLLAIEYDRALVETLNERFAQQPHVRILHADARTINYAKLLETVEGKYRQVKIIANLPYYAAIPILLTIFRESRLFVQCTLMFQKEVAERIVSVPGQKSYGTLSVTAQYYSRTQYDFTIPPGAFSPPPKVESAVVTLTFSDFPKIALLDQAHFFQLVKTAFLTRRKTLKNSLVKHGNGVFQEDVLCEAFDVLHINQQIRGEMLSVEDFAALSNMLIRLQAERTTVCEK